MVALQILAKILRLRRYLQIDFGTLHVIIALKEGSTTMVLVIIKVAIM